MTTIFLSRSSKYKNIWTGPHPVKPDPNVIFDEKQVAIEFSQVDTKIFGKITERPSGNSVLQASNPPAPVNSICKWKALKCVYVVTCAWTIATNCI